MLYWVTRPRRLRGPDGNAWKTGFWPAGRTLDTPGLGLLLKFFMFYFNKASTQQFMICSSVSVASGK